ncbi:hypothetical protein VTK73DRAFT_2455 [Phialemonium thermophilum]|uniref:Uncharacterized protein n=1 Tax=Phialemonium thermophilum TaxID=223376 RepID=A0ABR3X4F4_9PEZI
MRPGTAPGFSRDFCGPRDYRCICSIYKHSRNTKALVQLQCVPDRLIDYFLKLPPTPFIKDPASALKNTLT